MKKVIITASAHYILQKTFEENGCEVLYQPQITYSELMTQLDGVDGLVVTTRIKVDKELINAATSLKWIGRLGSGLELIDTEYAKSKGISCFSTPEGNCTAVGEQALLLLLSLKRHLVRASNEVKDGIWLRNENRGNEINGITVGIIGYGNTGAAFAKVLAGFNIKVLACDKYKTDFANGYVHESTMKEMQEEAEVISFHLPLTDETFHMGSASFFDGCKRKPVIINTSRGAVIDTAALLHALQSGKVSAAGLDVLENEKFSTYNEQEKFILDALRNMDQVVLTPHIAGYTHEAYYKMSAFLLEKLGYTVTDTSW